MNPFFLLWFSNEKYQQMYCSSHCHIFRSFIAFWKEKKRRKRKTKSKENGERIRKCYAFTVFFLVDFVSMRQWVSVPNTDNCPEKKQNCYFVTTTPNKKSRVELSRMLSVAGKMKKIATITELLRNCSSRLREWQSTSYHRYHWWFFSKIEIFL